MLTNKWLQQYTNDMVLRKLWQKNKQLYIFLVFIIFTSNQMIIHVKVMQLYHTFRMLVNITGNIRHSPLQFCDLILLLIFIQKARPININQLDPQKKADLDSSHDTNLMFSILFKARCIVAVTTCKLKLSHSDYTIQYSS